MPLFLYAVAAWIAIDVLLVVAWHRAHVIARRGGIRTALEPAVTSPVHFLAPQAPHRFEHPSTLPARPAYQRLIDA